MCVCVCVCVYRPVPVNVTHNHTDLRMGLPHAFHKVLHQGEQFLQHFVMVDEIWFNQVATERGKNNHLHQQSNSKY